MARIKRKEFSRYENPFWEISYEYQHGKDVILPGTPIKIKGERGVFTFQRVVFHKEKQVSWIDCYSPSGYRAFYVDRLKGAVKTKKKRKKRDVQGS